MTQDELNILLDAHETWLTSNKVSGNKLNVAGTDIKDLSLDNRKLMGAVFTAAVMENCNFQNTDLREADLSLTNANSANFMNANMQFAILDAANFLGANIAGVNFQGANTNTLQNKTIDWFNNMRNYNVYQSDGIITMGNTSKTIAEWKTSYEDDCSANGFSSTDTELFATWLNSYT